MDFGDFVVILAFFGTASVGVFVLVKLLILLAKSLTKQIKSVPARLSALADFTTKRVVSPLCVLVRKVTGAMASVFSAQSESVGVVYPQELIKSQPNWDEYDAPAVHRKRRSRVASL